MKKSHFWIGLLLLPLLAYSENAERNSGMIYGENHAFVLTAPKGWILDNQSGASQGLHAVFYPEGSSWKDGKTVMYANTAARKTGMTVTSFIKDDIERFRQQSPNLAVRDGSAIRLNPKQKALVRHFKSDAHGNSESVAYIEEEKVIVIIVLTARREKEWSASQDAFKSLVGSYRFLSDQVQFDKK